MAIHNIYGVKIGATTMLGGVQAQTVQLGSDVRGEPASGALYSEFVSLVAQRPSVSFTTLSVEAGLTEIPVLGFDLATTGGMTFYQNRHAQGGTREGTLAHRSVQLVSGIAVPRQLSVGHQGQAVMTLEAIGTSADGTTAPYVLADNITLPAAATDDERWTLGAATIAGVTIEGKQNVTIDFGVNVLPEGGDSDLWPTHASITTITPMITIEGIDPEWFNDSVAGALSEDLYGAAAAAHADTSIYLRKRAQGGTFAAGSVHIKLTADGMAWVDPVQSGQSGATSSLTLSLKPRFDGTNVPLVVAMSEALP